MNVQEYLHKLTEKLIESFPEITRIEYQYKENAGVHFLKILPQRVLKSETFAKFDGDISADFYEKNFTGMISFISEDSLVKLNNPETLYGLPEILLTQLGNLNFIEPFPVFNFLNTYINQKVFFPTIDPKLLSNGFQIPLIHLKEFPIRITHNTIYTSHLSNVYKKEIEIKNEYDVQIMGETSYSLAA